MLSLNNIWLLALLLKLCSCVFVEISLDNNKSLSLQLVCRPDHENFFPKTKNHTVLWNGYEFGRHQQQKLSERLHNDVLVPNLSIKSSKTHQCYLLAASNNLSHLSKRNADLAQTTGASIPLKNGICPPGHRIDQDRCFPCFPGSFTSGQDTECFLCPKDFYVDKKAADSCWPCPDSKKTLGHGADSEEACFSLDETGHPVNNESNTLWLLMVSSIVIVIVCVWVIIILLLIRHCRNLKRDDAEVLERGKRESVSRRKSQHPQDDGTSGDEPPDASEHIYEEIGDDVDDADDTYEIPRKVTDPPEYVELDAPEIPPKRRSQSTQVPVRQSVDSGMYEIPIGRSSRHPPTSSRRKNTGVQTEDRMKRISEDGYEVPIKVIRSEPSYEVPITSSRAKHSYEAEIRTSRPQHSYETPITISRPKHSYEARKAYSSDDDDMLDVIDDASGHTYDVIEDLPDDLPYITNEESNKSDVKRENERRAPKTRSTGFEPVPSTSRGVRTESLGDRSSDGSDTREIRTRSMEDPRQKKKWSGGSLDNIYDYPPSDEEQ